MDDPKAIILNENKSRKEYGMAPFKKKRHLKFQKIQTNLQLQKVDQQSVGMKWECEGEWEGEPQKRDEDSGK